MIIFRHLLAAGLMFGSLCLLPGTARAAQSYDSCAGFIDSLPATITTQGVWCLRKDLATSMASGNAITVATNNVTIDCNDFKIGGLGAGNASATMGIHAQNRQNVTVRHCNIRGFYMGIVLYQGSGHLVEDNRLDNNLSTGIYANDIDNSLVQRNRVFDTGGYPGEDDAYGIYATADVVDNIVAGVFAASNVATNPAGIRTAGNGTTARGNHIRGLAVAGTGSATGISLLGVGNVAYGNQIIASNDTPGYGIRGNNNTTCNNNIVVNFANNHTSCIAAANNTYLP